MCYILHFQSDPHGMETQPLLRDQNAGNQSVQLKRHIGLLHASAIVIGNMAGMGIFITPTGILQGVGSVGLSLVVWAMSGEIFCL